MAKSKTPPINQPKYDGDLNEIVNQAGRNAGYAAPSPSPSPKQKKKENKNAGWRAIEKMNKDETDSRGKKFEWW